MLLKPPRPQTKWFWKTNSQLDPFLAFKTSNTKNNPIVVDEILACPSSNFDFFSRFGNWATSTSTCSTNFYDRFFWLALKTERNGFIHHSHVLLSFLMLVSFFSHTKWSTCPKSENLVAFLRFEVPMCDSLCGPVVKLAAFWWPPHESKTTKNIPNFNLVTFRKYEHRIFTSLSKDKFFVLQWKLVASGFK